MPEELAAQIVCEGERNTLEIQLSYARAEAEALAERERVWAKRHLAEQQAANRMVEKAEADAKALAEALVVAAVPLEVLAGQIRQKRYAELTDELQGEIVAAVEPIRDALARYRGKKPWCTCGAKTPQGQGHKPSCPARYRGEKP